MNRQSQEDALLQSQVTNSGVSEDNLPTNGLHGFIMRHMGHQDVAHSKNKQTKSISIIPILLLIMVVLHIVAAIFLAKTGSTGFSFNNPMTYGMIGLFVVFVIAKLRLVIGSLRRKETVREITDDVGTTGSGQRE
jgi:uncharacterized membrane protein